MGDKLCMKKFKKALLVRRAEMVGDSLHLKRDAKGEGGHRAPIHMADSASDTQEQEFMFERLSSSTATLQEIDEALERIEDGSYGKCEACETDIGSRRLKAKPYATKCIECKRKEEEG